MAAILTLRNPFALICAAFLATVPGTHLRAQSSPIQSGNVPSPFSARPTAVVQLAYDSLPDAPIPQTQSSQADDQQPGGSISGTVADPHGAMVSDARIDLENIDTGAQRTTKSDGGGFFNITALQPGTYKVVVSSAGFAPTATSDIFLQLNEIHNLPLIVLRVATASTNVDVTFTRHDLAEEQIHQQEQQRVLGIVPNFYVTYNWNAVPLTAKQKFKLGLRSVSDPVAFLGAGFAAGIEQWADGYSGYGQGAAGYAKRFGASYGDAFNGTMLGGAVLPALLRQDPRYFYKGTGSTRSRILYAISTVVICKGDNGRWQPNYSNVLGSLAGAGISNLYYPSTDRHGATLTIRNALIGTSSGAINSLFQEFLVKKISRGVPPQPQPASTVPPPAPQK